MREKWGSFPDSALIQVHLCNVDLISSILLLLCPLEREQGFTFDMFYKNISLFVTSVLTRPKQKEGYFEEAYHTLKMLPYS